MREIRVLSPTAILGYGFPLASFKRGMDLKPHVLAVDAGSTDPGPYYLGAGVSFTDGRAVKRDLEVMLLAAKEQRIPVIVGTAGGSGAKPHLDWCVNIVREIAREHQLHFKMAIISADISEETITEALAQEKIKALQTDQMLTETEFKASANIVGQMGVEPFINALEEGAEVIIAGRAYDPAVFAALPIWRGFDPGLALHMGKILECAAIAATPGSGSDCMFGTIRADHFCLEPLNPERKCTTMSVAAHTLYEKTDPYLLPGPGGVLDLRNCRFIQETDNRVKVTGSRFVPDDQYTVKLEGAKLVGYRTLSIAGARDPVFIEHLPEIIAGVKERLADNFREISQEDYHLHFHVYGRDGVMGDMEPTPVISSHEIGIVMEVVARTQELADTLLSFARSTMLHYGYPHRVSTAGNLAFPYSPSDLRAGAVYRFNAHHLLEIDDPVRLFPMKWEIL
jgi:hypothetical protein